MRRRRPCVGDRDVRDLRRWSSTARSRPFSSVVASSSCQAAKTASVSRPWISASPARWASSPPMSATRSAPRLHGPRAVPVRDDRPAHRHVRLECHHAVRGHRRARLQPRRPPRPRRHHPPGAEPPSRHQSAAPASARPGRRGPVQRPRRTPHRLGRPGHPARQPPPVGHRAREPPPRLRTPAERVPGRRSGPVRRSLTSHAGAVWSVAFGQIDGYPLVRSGGDDRTIRHGT